jgi:UDP-N-acetylglucosamine diphosphorylase / glucose-1-phosphate thymidylyltransferase / UDP-N-acetylgalactosamine diphosphorylase / glucosamine-1-phosphate N-acetyltransferase / galactosamine-1-phosphate N-acetyltransferase
MIVVFEDIKTVNNLKPFSLVRPLHDLKSGYLSIIERFSLLFNDEVKVVSRAEVDYVLPETRILKYQDVTRAERIAFVNAAYLYPEKELLDINNSIVIYDERVISLNVKAKDIDRLEILLEGIYQNDIEKVFDSLKENVEKLSLKPKNFVEYPWDLVYLNTFLMEKDFELIKRGLKDHLFIEPSNLSIDIEGDKELVIISNRAKISKNVFIDVTNGPVFIDEEAQIGPFTLIEGASYIGKKTKVSQARLREGTNIRYLCKVSGEVEESIIDSFSNKNHEGFLGHSYVGQWVNIGAMATNSDLKNTYDNVKVFIEPRRVVDTGLLKVGCFIGDFSKIGIGVLINTGTMIGLGANVFFEGELVRKYVPNFAWGGKEPYKKFPFDRFISMAKTMFSRRGREFPKTLEELLTRIYNNS